MFIDADAHVDECDETWSYFPKSKDDLRPKEMVFKDGPEATYQGRLRRGLFIDGEVFMRRTRDDALTQTTVDTRELYDVPARVRQMDDLGVGIQVIYPSTLLGEVTRRPELEVAICESYNRWMADRCRDSNGRLQWTATLPLLSIPDALKEMRRVKEDGAVAIFKRALETDDRRAGDPYFFPVYELAQELDLPIGIHSSSPYSHHSAALTALQPEMSRSLYVVDAFLSLLAGKVMEKFPRLRVGFVEAGSGWVPYAFWMSGFDSALTTQFSKNSTPFEERVKQFAARDTLDNRLAENRLYVTCEATEDLPFIISRVGDSNLCVGTDYADSDRSSLLMSHRILSESAPVEPSIVQKLVEDNAANFYGLHDVRVGMTTTLNAVSA